MKTRLFLFPLLLISLIFLEFEYSSDQAFYYAFNKKVPLSIKENNLIVVFDDGIYKEKAENLLKDFFANIKIDWLSSNTA